MRLWYQSMTELGALPEYRAELQAHVLAASPEGVEVDIRGVRDGTYAGGSPMQVLRYPLTYALALRQVLDNVREAERQGYDAFVMGSFVAPYLREARASVDLPVISMVETCLTVATGLARQSSLVCISPEQANLVSEAAATFGLTSRVAAVTPLASALLETELSRSFAEPDAIIALFGDAARRGIAAGGDVVIPAEGILSELVRRDGCLEIDGAPVMDVVAVSIEYACMMARLWRTTGLHPGRLTSFPRPPADLIERLLEVTP
jgi:Asp/Glu/hydantoin racemase